MNEELLERFMDKFVPEPNSGCWLWTGALYTQGYGSFWDGAKSVRAHRFAYEYFVGPIPDGLMTDHLCRVRCCINPKHLELVTPRENTLRGISFAAVNSKLTHCKRGHELTKENTRIYPVGGVWRRCRICDSALARRMREAQKQKLYGVGLGMANGKKTHCIHGHEFNAYNTFVRANGSRVCRECNRVRRLTRAALSGEGVGK